MTGSGCVQQAGTESVPDLEAEEKQVVPWILSRSGLASVAVRCLLIVVSDGAEMVLDLLEGADKQRHI